MRQDGRGNEKRKDPEAQGTTEVCVLPARKGLFVETTGVPNFLARIHGGWKAPFGTMALQDQTEARERGGEVGR
jgi:hypothetical protein